MTVLLIQPPSVEPVTLAEAKAHLRIAGDDDDEYLAAQITAARIQVETTTRRLLVDQVWRIYRDDWPANGRIDLPLTPVADVVEVVLYDESGTPSVLPPARWRLDTAATPARLALIGTPPVSPRLFNGLEIDVRCGFGPSGLSVPQPLRLAIVMLVARWYENREGYGLGIVPSSVADAFEALVAPHRVMRLS